ncbi:MAG TPA: DUF1330 domain-containing protein [Solirubrobacteraceae bacterium]|nr:DUF1330 domain-containing protein [Solirubrobacteraceae bacterium]
MKHYMVAEMEITDPSWIRDYVANVTGMVERRGGRYLSRTGQIEKVEGDRRRPQFIVLIEWPSKEAADDFYASEEYRPYRQARERGASNEFLLAAGEDVNGVAQMAG